MSSERSFSAAGPRDGTTQVPSGVASTSANLHASISAHSLATEYFFEWGRTTTDERVTARAAAPQGTESWVSTTVTGLTPGRSIATGWWQRTRLAPRTASSIGSLRGCDPRVPSRGSTVSPIKAGESAEGRWAVVLTRHGDHDFGRLQGKLWEWRSDRADVGGEDAPAVVLVVDPGPGVEHPGSEGYASVRALQRGEDPVTPVRSATTTARSSLTSLVRASWRDRCAWRSCALETRAKPDRESR